MKIKTTLAAILFIQSFLLFSCTKSNDLNVLKNSGDLSGNISLAASTLSLTNVVNVGTGSGQLTIDGNNLALKCNGVIKIKGGNYSNIVIKNINEGCPITIQNNGLVQMTGNDYHMQLTNLSNVTISGAGTTGIDKGFVSKNNNYRSMVLNGSFQNLTIQNFSFSNIGDYVVSTADIPVYDGSAKSYTNNLKFLNIDCANTNSFLQSGGDVTSGQTTGLMKNLEIDNLNFSNSNCGNVVFIGVADDYNIHNSTISNINQTNNNHNGIFLIKGSGSFHNNLIKNHQGNAIRAWARSFGTTPKDILIYNNTVVNSRKYSGFEVQAFAEQLIPGKTVYANAKVYNNICGSLDLTKDWIGVVVDVYNLFGGTCQVYNNTGFNFPSPNPKSNIVNQQSVTAPSLSNNHYFQNAFAAGIPNVDNLQIQK